MKPSDNEIEMLAAGFAILHKNGLIRFAHALLEKYASARAIAFDASTEAAEAPPVAYLTRDEEGSPCMLFFDVVEARGYCAPGEEPEPLFRHAGPQADSEPVGWFDTSMSSGTVRWRPGLTSSSFPEGHPFYAAPQASALNAGYTRGRADGFDAGHGAALEKAAAALEDHRKAGREWVPGSLWDTLSREAAARIRALKQPQADKGGSQQRAAEASAPDTAKDRVDKILRERMAPISEALGLDVMLASVCKDGFQIITFEFETLVYSIGSDGAAILRVSFNCSHAPDTLTADQVQIISQAAAEVRPVGGEVLAWLDQHRGVTSRPATAMSSLELYRQWRAAEQAQAAAPCTRPSGEGSLRHPCAAHPAKASGNGGEEWSDS
ncbi:hypothetical protein ACOTH8_23405 [Achromobacter xylosoxidans]